MIVLLNAHGQRLYRLLLRLTLREEVAEDLLQDLTVKLLQADGFAHATEPYAYARTAAMNLARNWFRSRTRNLPLSPSSLPDPQPPIWAGLVDAEEVQQLLQSISELSEKDRVILTMRYFDDAGYDEIARACGNTAHQARALCAKSIARLRAAMTRSDDAPSPQTTGTDQ